MAIYGNDNPFTVYRKNQINQPYQTQFTNDNGNWRATSQSVPYSTNSQYGMIPVKYQQKTSVDMPSGWNPFEANIPWTQRASIGSDAQRQTGFLTGMNTTGAPKLSYDRYMDKKQSTLNKYMGNNYTRNFNDLNIKSTYQKRYNP